MFALRPVACVVLLIFGIVSGREYYDDSYECSDYPSQAENCWSDNTDLPVCTTRNPMLDCISNVVSMSRKCNYNIVSDIKIKQDMYRTLHNVICSHSELHREFADDDSCWIHSRSCAYEILESTVDGQERDEDQCRALTDRFEACKGPLKESSCSNLQNLFIDIIRRDKDSPCSGVWNAPNIVVFFSSLLFILTTCYFI